MGVRKSTEAEWWELSSESQIKKQTSLPSMGVRKNREVFENGCRIKVFGLFVFLRME